MLVAGMKINCYMIFDHTANPNHKPCHQFELKKKKKYYYYYSKWWFTNNKYKSKFIRNIKVRIKIQLHRYIVEFNNGRGSSKQKGIQISEWLGFFCVYYVYSLTTQQIHKRKATQFLWFFSYLFNFFCVVCCRAFCWNWRTDKRNRIVIIMFDVTMIYTTFI